MKVYHAIKVTEHGHEVQTEHGEIIKATATHDLGLFQTWAGALDAVEDSICNGWHDEIPHEWRHKSDGPHYAVNGEGVAVRMWWVSPDGMEKWFITLRGVSA